jgi:ankyrin repeat protein
MTEADPAALPPLDAETLAFAQQIFDLARDSSGERGERLAAYLDHGMPPDLTNDKGDTLLLLAAYHQQHSAVRDLLAHGADPDRVNDKGQTALAAAVFRKDRDLVVLLREHGADPLAGDPTALATATFFQAQELLDLLQ